MRALLALALCLLLPAAALGQATFGTQGAGGGGGGSSSVPNRTVTSCGSCTILSTDVGGQVNFNGTSLTAVIPAISSTVLPALTTIVITNQNASPLTISSTPALNGIVTTGTGPFVATVPQNAGIACVSNGTSLDCAAIGLPVATTTTLGAVKVDGSTITISGGVISTVGGGGGAMTLVSTLTANNSSGSLAWTGLTGTHYQMRCDKILTATASDNLFVQFGEGGTPTWEVANYTAGNIFSNIASASGPSVGGGTGQAGIPVSAGATSAPGNAFTMDLYGLSATGNHAATGLAVIDAGGSILQLTTNGVYVGDTNPITAVRLFDNSGHNLASGTCSLYAIAS